MKHEDKSSTWCPVPWVHYATRNNGELRLCCHANTAKERGILRREDGSAYRTNGPDVDEARNSRVLKETRISMLKGEWSPHCLRCQREESAGMHSRRMVEGELWSHRITFEQTQVLTQEDGSLPEKEFPLRSFDLRFGNFCNLKCRMCGPTDSSYWYEDHLKLYGNQFSDTHGKVSLEKKGLRVVANTNHYDWNDDDQFWKYLYNHKDSADSFYFVGGEPLIIRKHYDFLQELVDCGRAREVTIEYNSNLTKLPTKALELWSQFKTVKVGVSLDGFGFINDYIRFPSQWDEIETHLRVLDQTEDNHTVWLTVTLMAYNIFYLPEIISWSINSQFKKFNCYERNLIMTPHPLHNPVKLNMKVFPKAVKKRIKEKLESYIHGFPDTLKPDIRDQVDVLKYKKRIQFLVDSYCNYMFAEDRSESFPSFWRFTKQLDKIRGQNFEKSFPEFYDILRPHINRLAMGPLT